jgi:hypothetical protein
LWTVPLEIDDPSAVRTQHLHHHVCAWLEPAGNGHRNSMKPFTITPLRPFCDGSAFDITLLIDGLEPRLSAAVGSLANQRVRLGRTEARLRARAPVILQREYPWLEMFGRARGNRAWQADFLTPCSFRHGDIDLPFPMPGSVLRHLCERWVAYAPIDPLGNTIGSTGERRQAAERLRAIVEGSVRVAEFSGESAEILVSGRARTGFVGHVTYARTAQSGSVDRAVDCLMASAPYTGIGTMTTYGLGVVAVTPLPPARRR